MGINQLQQEFAQGRLALAYLIEASDLTGAKAALLQTLSATIYQQYEAGEAIADLKTISRLPEKKDITVSQVRELAQFLAKSSVLSGSKAVIICGGEYLNENSSNALLKIMEDSQSGNHIFIIASSYNALLPTITSRCRHIKYNTSKEVASYSHQPLNILLQLQDSNVDTADIFAKMKSSGDEIWQETSHFAQEILCRISQEKAGGRVEFSQQERQFAKRFTSLSLDATIMVYEKLTSFVDKVNQYDLPKLQSLVLLSEYFNLQDDKATV